MHDIKRNLKRIFAILICNFMMMTCLVGCDFLDNIKVPPDSTEITIEVPSGRYLVQTGSEKSGVDYILSYPSGKDITILQLTDIQLQNWRTARSQRQNPIRNAFFNGMSESHQVRAWQYTDEAVARVNPDLLVLTGDLIYGECDDNGNMWLELIAKMDSYQIPWLVVFGNHDNESAKGVRWQVSQLLNSEYCVFKQGSVTGNSNYNVLVASGGKAKYLLYMFDTNGCAVKPYSEGLNPDNVDLDIVNSVGGIHGDQINWYKNTVSKSVTTFGRLPILSFMHIPIGEARNSAVEKYSSQVDTFPFMPNQEGDFGIARESIVGPFNSTLWAEFLSTGCLNVYAGHQHKFATSIVSTSGLRVTYGLKVGTYDYHVEDMLGSTKIVLSENNGSVTTSHVYTNIAYSSNRT